jgi:hypothetical protein
MPLYKNCGWWKNFDYIFGFSVKSYVRNTINLSWDKILLTSVIDVFFGSFWTLYYETSSNISPLLLCLLFPMRDFCGNYPTAASLCGTCQHVTGTLSITRMLYSRFAFHKATSSVRHVIIITDIRPTAGQCLLRHLTTPHPVSTLSYNQNCPHLDRIWNIPHF